MLIEGYQDEVTVCLWRKHSSRFILQLTSITGHVNTIHMGEMNKGVESHCKYGVRTVLTTLFLPLHDTPDFWSAALSLADVHNYFGI